METIGFPGDAVSVSPAPRGTWAEVFRSDPHSTTQQSPAWFEAVLDASGCADVSRLYSLADGRRLVLPLMRRRPLPGMAWDGSYLASYGPGGILADGGLRVTDVSGVLTDRLGSDALSTRLRAGHHRAAVWQAGRPPAVADLPRHTHVLDLTGGFDRVVGERFSPSVRRAVRKAGRSGVSVRSVSGPELVPAFYDLYLRWTERRAHESGVPRRVALALARRREPLQKFLSITSRVGSASRTWLAFHDGEPIAGMITLAHGRHAAYWRGYSDKAVAGPSRANLLLQHLAIQDACERGCDDYDLGESGGVAGLEHFKETLGGRRAPHVELRIERLPLSRLHQVQAGAERTLSGVLARRSGARGSRSVRAGAAP